MFQCYLLELTNAGTGNRHQPRAWIGTAGDSEVSLPDPRYLFHTKIDNISLHFLCVLQLSIWINVTRKCLDSFTFILPEMPGPVLQRSLTHITAMSKLAVTYSHIIINLSSFTIPSCSRLTFLIIINQNYYILLLPQVGEY